MNSGTSTPRAKRRRSELDELGEAFKELLSPQRALPLRLRNASSRNASHSSRNDSSADISPITSDRESTPEWSKEEYEDMIHSLKEDGIVECLHEYLTEKKYSVPKMLRAFGKNIPDDAPETTDVLVDKLHTVMRQTLRKRDRIETYNTLSDAVKLIWRAQKIMVLTGAGISVSCGVPDFRSPDGIYAQIKANGQYELDYPQEMFSLAEFVRRPAMFYSFIGQLWPEDIEPSLAHEFIRHLEIKGKLLRNYTQNIDSLETVAGVEAVFACHGSFATASCMDCGKKVPGSMIKDDAINGRIPRCQPCVDKDVREASLQKTIRPKAKAVKKRKSQVDQDSDGDNAAERTPGLMKPSITFFGEALDSTFDNLLFSDREEVDLLLIMGTSLKVKPVSEILGHIPHSIPQILINKTPIEHANPDIVLLGDCDDIVARLCHELGYILPSQMEEKGQPRRKRKTEEVNAGGDYPRRLGDSHVWMFEGAKIPMPYARKFDPSFTRDRKTKKPRLN